MKLALFTFLFASVTAQEPESLARYLRAQTHVGVDPKTVELKDDSDQYTQDRRSFVRYESSEWEQQWLDHVDGWAHDEKICEILNSLEQQRYMHDFLALTCSARYEAPYNNWCIIDDEHRPLWYNTANRTHYE